MACGGKWIFFIIVVGIIHLKMVSQPHDDLWNGQS